jgi:hypothetical protein
LAQIAKRVTELSTFNTIANTVPKMFIPYLKNEHRIERHQLPQCENVFNNVYISNDFMLANDTKNKWFMTKNNDIVSMLNGTYFEGKIHIYGSALKTKSDFFNLPLKSSYLSIVN